MKAKILLLLFCLSSLCVMGQSDNTQGTIERKKCKICGKPLSRCSGHKPLKPEKTCKDCGKLFSKCKYHTKHPECNFCHNIVDKCKYNGNHPMCSDCNTIIDNCQYKGAHTAESLCKIGDELEKRGRETEAFAKYSKAAEKASPYAQSKLGNYFEYGHGTTKDKSKSEYWYNKAITTIQSSFNKEDASVQYILADCYKGLGDEQKALEWYCKSAAKDYEDAQRALGYMYHFGNGVKKNNSMAESLFLAAAKHGHPESQYALGSFYDDEHRYSEALEWFTKASEQGHNVAYANVGCCYFKLKNYNEAIKIFMVLANSDDANSMVWLGSCYKELGNAIEAVNWYTKAANKGWDTGMTHLGDCYYEGFGVEQNYQEAAKWYRKSLEKYPSKYVQDRITELAEMGY